MASKCLKEPGARPTTADLELDPLGTLGAMPNIGGLISIGVHARVDIAADEVHAEEFVAARPQRLLTRRRSTREIELSTLVGHEITVFFGIIDSFDGQQSPFYFGLVTKPTSGWPTRPSQIDSHEPINGIGKLARTLTEHAASDTVEITLVLVLATEKERNDRCLFIIPASATTTPLTRDLGILQTLERPTEKTPRPASLGVFFVVWRPITANPANRWGAKVTTEIIRKPLFAATEANC